MSADWKLTGRHSFRKRLSRTQRRMLARITPEGTSEAALAVIGGIERARALRVLGAAANAHNNGSAINSPLPRSVRVIADLVGKTTISGYRLVCDDPLIEEAIKALQAQRTYAATHGTETP